MIRGDFGAVATAAAAVAADAAASSLTILTGEASLLLARKLVVSSLITRGASSRLASSADFSWTMTMGDRSRVVERGFDDDEEEEDDLDSRSIGIVRSSDDEDDDSDVDDDNDGGKEAESILGDVNFAGGEGGFAETVEAACGGSCGCSAGCCCCC